MYVSMQNIGEKRNWEHADTGCGKSICICGRHLNIMEETYQKKSYTLFLIWLIIFVAASVLCVKAEPDFAHLGTDRTFLFLLYVMLDLLFLLITLTQSIYWISGTSYEEAASAGPKTRRSYALRHLFVFLAATALFLIYCYVPAFSAPGASIQDSLVAGGIVCAAAVATMRIHLEP